MNLRGQSVEAKRDLNRFVAHASDVFSVRWLLAVFGSQSTGAIAASGYVNEHLREYADLILDKHEHEEGMARSALMIVISSNWLAALSRQPPTVANGLAFVNEMLNI
jgi:hypothetical protein